MNTHPHTQSRVMMTRMGVNTVWFLRCDDCRASSIPARTLTALLTRAPGDGWTLPPTPPDVGPAPASAPHSGYRCPVCTTGRTRIRFPLPRTTSSTGPSPAIPTSAAPHASAPPP